MATIAATEISEAIKQYSMAVAPSSFFINLRKMDIINISWLNSSFVCTRQSRGARHDLEREHSCLNDNQGPNQHPGCHRKIPFAHQSSLPNRENRHMKAITGARRGNPTASTRKPKASALLRRRGLIWSSKQSGSGRTTRKPPIGSISFMTLHPHSFATPEADSR